MNEFVISINEKTRQAIDKLMVIVGAKDTGEVIQDSLRTLEWIIYHQSKGHHIAALDKSAVAVLEESEITFTIPILVSYIKSDQKQNAEDYFKEAP
jgi:hypothetical protein